ncbi:uncharacterized protein LOC133497655 isoform X2 [Syngnathoides biaculeatus]|uniref:uncharacterized protein LOC133497655 isoform X2 n=1 Tax=Syngnathoides biaculeatus TaxID=300417 RepID=UPI002ADD4CD1|nr:uncharacterized protein LOC133497655 isoform X2 [Syngnathoides biaculeatus]
MRVFIYISWTSCITNLRCFCALMESIPGCTAGGSAGNSEVPGSIPAPPVWTLHVLPVPAWVPSRRGLLPDDSWDGLRHYRDPYMNRHLRRERQQWNFRVGQEEAAPRHGEEEEEQQTLRIKEEEEDEEEGADFTALPFNGIIVKIEGDDDAQEGDGDHGGGAQTDILLAARPKSDDTSSHADEERVYGGAGGWSSAPLLTSKLQIWACSSFSIFPVFLEIRR